MTQTQVINDYITHGWSLVPIPPGTKGPRLAGWNTRGGALRSTTQLLPEWGVGLAHAYSGTMAFDIDSWELTRNHGIDLEALYSAPDAVTIESGKPGHGKLIYRMPFGLTLPSKKISIDRKTAFEFRCATAEGLTVQDILPPSIHPDTRKPYQWSGKGHWTRLPIIPTHLLGIWQDLLSKDRVTITVDGVDASWDDIQDALRTISPDCTRDEWISVGMALHWAGVHTSNVDQAFYIWNQWSKGSPKYPGDRGIISQWQSFRSDKGSTITLGTLFHIARQYGWTRPTPDASDLFGSVQASSPTDLVQSLRPAPPELDMSLFPPLLAKRAQEVSEHIGCDPLVPLFAGLGAVCGVVDAQSRLELMPGFKVPPVLWLMTIGDAADKKSPAAEPMLSPLRAIEMEDRPRYNKELLEWEAKEAAYSSAKTAFLNAAKDPEFLLGKNLPTVPEMPPQPVPLKFTVSDITSQKLVRLAADRPRGLLCHLDEMHSWVRKMNDKTSGEDRSTWVVSYESKPYEMDRVGAGSIHADNLAVSIYGNLHPKLLRENIDYLSSDGMLQRFIPVVLRHHKTRKGNPVPDFLTSAAAWENTLRMIFALPTMTYKLSPDAYAVYRDFQEWYEETKRDERLLQMGDSYMTAFGKLEGLAGRIALVFHVIENPFSSVVSAELIDRVIRLIKSYIIPAFRYTLGEIGGTTSFDLWVTDHVIQYCDQNSLTLSEVKRSGRRQLEHLNTHVQNQWVLNAMYNLEQAHWVARLDDGSKEHQGIAEWLINPALRDIFKEHRQTVIRAKQRRAEQIMKDRKSPVAPRVHGADDIG